MCKVHISLDDVKGIFKALTSETYDSIFQTRTLKYLKNMHDLYGVKIHLFCTYKDGDYNLENVPDCYVDEFKKNLDWLKFGFHCYEEKTVYSEGDELELERYFNRFHEQIKRITGQENDATAIRLHGFWGTEKICRNLQENGVKTLFAADDDRKSYNLEQRAEAILRDKGAYYDAAQDLMFVRSVTRLENAGDIIAEIEEKQGAGWDTISIFTHEWQMDREDIRKKFELCCQWDRERRMGYDTVD